MHGIIYKYSVVFKSKGRSIIQEYGIEKWALIWQLLRRQKRAWGVKIHGIAHSLNVLGSRFMQSQGDYTLAVYKSSCLAKIYFKS